MSKRNTTATVNTATVNTGLHDLIVSFHGIDTTTENDRYELPIETVVNSEKVDKLLNHALIQNAYIQYGINCTHDTSGYCGVDNGKNNTIIFSPNYKVKQTNIYTTRDIFDLLNTTTYDNTVFDGNTNTSSKTIPYTIVCKSLLDFEKMLRLLVENKMVRMIPQPITE